MRPADGLLPSSGNRTRPSRDVSGDVREPSPTDLTSLTSLECLGRLEPGGLHEADRLEDRTREAAWLERFGRTYYSFTYRSVLVVVLNTDDPPGHPQGSLSGAQTQWLAGTLDAHPDSRWTLVFLHRPLWIDDPASRQRVERLLGGSRRAIFSSHHHRYELSDVNGHSYYTLATTGGRSDLKGPMEGRFDHITWVSRCRIRARGSLARRCRTGVPGEPGCRIWQRPLIWEARRLILGGPKAELGGVQAPR